MYFIKILLIALLLVACNSNVEKKTLAELTNFTYALLEGNSIEELKSRNFLKTHGVFRFNEDEKNSNKGVEYITRYSDYL